MVGWMPYRSQRSETGVCSRRWSRRMAAFSWTGSRFRVFLGMGGPPLEVVAYSSRRLVPFQLKQNTSERVRGTHPSTSVYRERSDTERFTRTEVKEVLTVDDYGAIRRAYRDRKSIRE